VARARRVEALLLVAGPEGPYLLASASLRGRVEALPELSREIEGRVRFLLPPQPLQQPETLE
jgi:hypothetical protein